MVDDDRDDIRLTRLSLDESKFHIDFEAVEDGVEALAYLRRQGGYAGARRPDLIMMDLNMPKKDGRELLAEIKADPQLRQIPIVIMTTSDADQDVMQSYDLGANCYVTKPIDLEQFTTVVASIEEFWFTVVRLPPS
jgi:two-component system response regulator